MTFLLIKRTFEDSRKAKQQLRFTVLCTCTIQIESYLISPFKTASLYKITRKIERESVK